MHSRDFSPLSFFLGFAVMLILATLVILMMPVLACAGGLDDAVHLTEQRGAYVGFEFRWGGDRVQKFLHISGAVPRAGGAPLTAATGTRIQLSALSDLNPANWSRRDQILAVAGLGVAWWAVTAEHRHSRTRGAALATALPGDDGPGDDPDPGPGVDDDDSDSGGWHRHCTDGHGQDGEKNKHCR